MLYHHTRPPADNIGISRKGMANPYYIVTGSIQIPVSMISDPDIGQNFSAFQGKWLVTMKFLHAADSKFMDAK
jgi:hypothetical protein